MKIPIFPSYHKNILNKAWQVRYTVSMLKEYIKTLEKGLEDLNARKDRFLYGYLEIYWPRRITPNQLSWFRVCIGILLFVLLFNFKNENGLVIFPLFLIGVLTDLLDGAVARHFNQITRLGEMLDPLADRILLIPIFIYTIIDFKTLLSCIILFEIINALISLFTQGKNIFFGSNIFGKTKMFLQSVVLVAILLFWPQIPNFFFISLLWVSVACAAISVILKGFEVRSYYHARKVARL